MALIQTYGFDYHQEDARHRVIRTKDGLDKAIAWLEQQPLVAVDTETSGLRWDRHSRICGVSMAAWHDGHPLCFYFPCRHQTGERQLLPEDVMAASRRVLEDTRITKVLHNRKFDQHMFMRDRVLFKGCCRDTTIDAWLWNENESIALKNRAQKDLNDPRAHEFEDILDRALKRVAKQHKMEFEVFRDMYGYARLPVMLCGIYACWDVDFTLRLAKFYDDNNVQQFFRYIYEQETDLIQVLFEMEEFGLPINSEYLQWLAGETAAEMDRLRPIVQHDMGVEFNPASDAELRDILINRMGLGYRMQKRTRGGEAAVDAEVLEELAADVPGLTNLVAFREAGKIHSTGCLGLLEHIGFDGLLHGDFKQLGTATGRLSAEKPNLQNVGGDSDARAIASTGKKVEDGGQDPWSLRRAFILRGDDTTPTIFDYSQIELRVLAKYSGDPTLLDVYLTGGDVHTRTAMEVFGNAHKSSRRDAKVINFGLCVSGHQKVLTDKGLVRLDEVSTTHLVWDGVEWVHHDGLVCRGEHEVVTYDGVEATPDHVVFTTDGRKIRIGCLASQPSLGRIARGSDGDSPARYDAYAYGPDTEAWESPRCGSCMWCLREDSLGIPRRSEERTGVLPVSEGQVQGPARGDAWATLRRHGSTMRAGYTRLFTELQGAWHQSVVQVSGAFHPLGAGVLSACGLQGDGLRSNQQRRALRAEELEAGASFCELGEQAAPRWGHLQAGASAVGGQLAHEQEGPAGLHDVHAPVRAGLPKPPTRRALVYDLLNAGPRHRFTVSGKVVSNSYGMAASGYAKKTKKPREEAEADLQRFYTRYPRIQPFQREFWEACRMRTPASFVNMYGRPRRVPELHSEDKWDRLRAERQAFSTLIQGTAAQLTKNSLVFMWRWEQHNRTGMKICRTIHDDIRIDIPNAHRAECIAAIVQMMESYPEFNPVPILVDGKYTITNESEELKVPKEQMPHVYKFPAAA